jgi:[ribosomal protein S18]-alanine N-acetyltransferase
VAVTSSPVVAATPGWRVEDMRELDLDRVEAIGATAFDPPWTRRGFEDEMARDVARCRVVKAGPAGTTSDLPVIGYAIWWIIGAEQQLLAIATDPACRRAGIARALLSDMIEEGARRGVTECFLEVRPSNTAAIALYEALGFARVDVRHVYYDDGEDAWVFLRRA